MHGLLHGRRPVVCFIIFVREKDSNSGMSMVTVWQLDFSVAGKHCQVTNLHMISVNKVRGWGMLNDLVYPVNLSLICRRPAEPARSPPVFPMILKMATATGQKPLVLIRCLPIPTNIHEAIIAAGPLSSAAAKRKAPRVGFEVCGSLPPVLPVVL